MLLKDVEAIALLFDSVLIICIICRMFKQLLLLLFVNQMASGLFRATAAIARNMILANTFGSFVLLLFFALGGVVLSKGILD